MQLSLTKFIRLHNKSLFLLTLIGIAAVINHSQIKGLVTNMTPSEIISITNATRQSAGLNPLHPQDQLMKAAEAKAMAMIAANAWSHNTPTETPWQFIQGEGYTYTLAGENLAKGFKSAEEVVEAWLNSPSHKENLLNNQYTDTGVAVIEAGYQNKEKTTLVVQFLAKAYDPAIATAESREANQPPLLVQTLESKNMSFFLIGLLVASLLSIVISIFFRLISGRRRKNRPPKTAYWKS